MALTIKLKQGTKTQLGTISGLTAGEPLWVTDTQELFIATGATTYKPAAIDVAALDDLGAVATGDLFFVHDISQLAAAPKARKITFENLKTALNIPAGSTDELVAAASGATAGYLGTTGAEGVLRTGVGISMVAGGANAFVTIALSFASQAQGDIIYRGATDWARLAAGSAGQLLQTNGAASNPSWIGTIDGGTFA